MPVPVSDDRPKRQRRKDARPGELVEAAFHEFAAKGFEATRLEDVAARAGVAKGTIYRYFDNKTALFDAAVRQRLLPILENLEGQVARFDGPTGALLEMLVRTLHANLLTSEAPVLMRIIVAEGARFPEIAEHYHREAISKGREIIRRIIARGIARGEIRPGPALEVPMVLMSPAVMAALWQTTFGRIDPVPHEALVEAHVDLLLRAIGARETTPDAGLDDERPV